MNRPQRAQDLYAEARTQVLGRLVRRYGIERLDMCEDAVQEALLDAHEAWEKGDRPADPVAWLLVVARRRYVDHVRADIRRRGREANQALLTHPLAEAAAPSRDDSLLLFTLCCHPELPRPMQVALTLRAVAGLTTEQIARAYQVPTPTIAQRITRAKHRLSALGRTFGAAASDPGRLDAVRNVLYLMFTEAHQTTSGEPVHDVDLAAETIRLVRLLHAEAPGHPETAGLLALMLLTEARQPARTTADGALVPLDRQDRSRWDRELIAEGLALVGATVPGARPGPYLLQACIAALHAEAPSTADTDWREILALYRALGEVAPGNPAVTLNRAVAEAMVFGPEHALGTLDGLRAELPRNPQLFAVTARLLADTGRREEAADAYREAMKRTNSTAELRYFRARLHELGG